MENLENIAAKKLEIEVERLKESFQKDLEAMISLHASKGLVRSGATIQATIDLSKRLFFSFRDICNNVIQDTIDGSVFVSESSANEIKSSISNMFLQLYGETFSAMTKYTKLASKPDLRDRFMPEIEKERKNTLSEVTMFIDARLITKRNKGIKGAIKSFTGILSKLFGSPAN